MQRQNTITESTELQRIGFLVWKVMFAAAVCGSAPSCNRADEPSNRTPAPRAPATTVETSTPGTPEVSDVCMTAVQLVCGEMGEESGVCGLLRSSAKTMRESRCENMLADRAQTLAEMRSLEESRMPLNAERRSKIETDDAPVTGWDDAPVTVTVFANYHCGPCVQMGLTVSRLPVWYEGKVRVIHRIHPAQNSFSDLAARGIYAAERQGKFEAYSECLYNNQHDMDEAAVKRCAEETGMAMKRFLNDRESEKTAQSVRRDWALGEEMRVGLPPYFFVNGARVSPGDGEFALRQAIENALRTSRE